MLGERTIPEWGKDLDWGYLPICSETVQKEVRCNYGHRHYIPVPRCSSVVEESRTYGKRRLIQCEKENGHPGTHRVITDFTRGYAWID